MRGRVEDGLTRRLQAERESIQEGAVELLPVFDAVAQLTLRGGKRFRAALLVLGYRVARTWRGAVIDEVQVLPAALAMELLQTYLLVHDDWMDEDEVRRGGPSVHAALRQHYDDAKLGGAGAILAGDYASALSLQLLGESRVPAEALLGAYQLFAAMSRDVVLGQSLDVLVDGEPAALPRLVERTHAWKTASYTTVGPLVVGARLGGATHAEIEALRAFGEPLGVAFQLRDDWLGSFGDEQITGKSALTDLRVGKKTCLLAVLAEQPELEPMLRAFLRGGGRRERADAEVAIVHAAWREHRVSERVEQRLAEESRRARLSLGSLPLDAAHRPLFEGMIDALLERRQ